MRYPTRGAILALVAGFPPMLILALLVPDMWYLALGWPLSITLLTIIDGRLGPSPRQARARLDLPRQAGVGTTIEARLRIDLEASKASPGRVHYALELNELLEPADDQIGLAELGSEGSGTFAVPLRTRRRGMAEITRLWLRWAGPLRLCWTQAVIPLGARTAILPDLSPVHQRGARIFQRHALQGLIAQLDRGDGVDFDTLVEFRPGMDRRSIDWKQSARHMKLHAKETRSERNNQIVFAMDCGRQMSEPVAGLSRLDRATSAMLLTSWVALKLGDRVALHAFDSRPRVASGLVAGVGAFGALQSVAAEIDYSGDETNYTYALTNLAAKLGRRSMIVLFTEFTDLTSAEFLVKAAARLLQTHLLLVVVLRDEELEAIVDRRPADADDVTRAVTAAALLRNRATVLTRLRHLGAHLVESEHGRVADRLVEAYADLKRRNLL